MWSRVVWCAGTNVSEESDDLIFSLEPWSLPYDVAYRPENFKSHTFFTSFSSPYQLYKEDCWLERSLVDSNTRSKQTNDNRYEIGLNRFLSKHIHLAYRFQISDLPYMYACYIYE
jgi:hypothetical protein